MAPQRPPFLRREGRYALATLLLMAALMGAYGFWGVERTRREVMASLEERASLLAQSVAISSANAQVARGELEAALAERLSAQAALVELLLEGKGAESEARLRELLRRERVARLLVFDGRGRLVRGVVQEGKRAPRAPLPPRWRHRGIMGPGGMMGGRMGERMLRFMMSRWVAPVLRGEVGRQVMRFGPPWAGGRLLGVAVARKRAPGALVLQVEEGLLQELGRKVGAQRLLESLRGTAGIRSISLVDAEGRILAHTDPSRVGRQAEGDWVGETLRDGGRRFRTHDGGGKGPTFEVAQAYPLPGGRRGVLQVGVEMEAAQALIRRARWQFSLLALTLLGAGAIGYFLIAATRRSAERRSRALEEQMRRAEKLSALGQLAAGVAHEVRNPLNAIALGVQRLQGEFAPRGVEGEKGDAHRELTDLIRREVRRLDSIVSGFLSYARTPRVERHPVALAPLLERIRMLLAEPARKAGVELRVETSPGLPEPVADPSLLEQSLLNLALNGLQAMEEGGKLTLSARRAGEEVLLAIADTGPGMDREILERSFEPFFSTKADGTGLGLPIAHRMVEEQGGRLEAESAPGRGTTFTIRLPLEGGKGGKA